MPRCSARANSGTSRCVSRKTPSTPTSVQCSSPSIHSDSCHSTRLMCARGIHRCPSPAHVYYCCASHQTAKVVLYLPRVYRTHSLHHHPSSSVTKFQNANHRVCAPPNPQPNIVLSSTTPHQVRNRMYPCFWLLPIRADPHLTCCNPFTRAGTPRTPPWSPRTCSRSQTTRTENY